MIDESDSRVRDIKRMAALMAKYLMNENPAIHRVTLSIMDAKYEYSEKEGKEREAYLKDCGKHYDFLLMAYANPEFAGEYLQTLREHRVSVHWPQATDAERRSHPPQTIETAARAVEIRRNGNYHSMYQLRSSEVAYLLLTGSWGPDKLITALKETYPEHRQLLNRVLFPCHPDIMIVGEGWQQQIDELLEIRVSSEYFGSSRYSEFDPQWLYYASAYEQQFNPATGEFGS